MPLARRGTLASVFLLATLAGGARLVAQTAAPGAAACVPDTTARDTVRQVVYVTRPNPLERSRDAETRDVRALLAAQELVPYFHAPASVAVADAEVVQVWRAPIVDGMIAFVLTPAGRVDAVEVLFTTRSPALDSALVAAVHRADSANAFRGLSQEAADTMLLHISADVEAPAGAVPLFRVRALRRRLDDPAKVLHMAAPHYPPAALASGAEDRIVTQFIIGRDGRAEPASFRVLSGRYREFAVAARDAVLRTTFKPGMVGDCPVRQLVELPISFSSR